jgi:hypothetical protein
MKPAGSWRAAVEEMRLTYGRSLRNRSQHSAKSASYAVGPPAVGQNWGELTSFQTTTSRIFGIRFSACLRKVQ